MWFVMVQLFSSVFAVFDFSDYYCFLQSQIREEHPLLVTKQTAIARKLGFPEVIMPGMFFNQALLSSWFWGHTFHLSITNHQVSILMISSFNILTLYRGRSDGREFDLFAIDVSSQLALKKAIHFVFQLYQTDYLLLSTHNFSNSKKKLS